MTTITLKPEGSLTALRVNGRLICFEPRITRVENVSGGKWQGEAGGEPFEIIGGRKSGGASNEWFVKWPHLNGDKFVHAQSAAQAVRMIETC